ncbi:MAG: hypothetical protein ACIALR_15645 [Blastopirellula sp. JB062]
MRRFLPPIEHASPMATLLLTTAFCLPLAIGCRYETERQGLVSGVVTLDDQPLENGSISFLPIDGKTATAGGIIKNGQFSISMPPGKKKVEIVGAKVIGQRAAYAGDKNSPMVDVTKEIVPSQYNVSSQLVVDVATGENHEKFVLTSK